MVASGNKRSSRHTQPATFKGAGVQYLSPIKLRDRRKKKVVVKCGSNIQAAAAEARLQRLLGREMDESAAEQAPETLTDQPDGETEMDWVDDALPPAILISTPPRPTRHSRMQLPSSWAQVLPLLELPFAQYWENTHGQPPSFIATAIQHNCSAACGVSVTATVHCLYVSRAYSTCIFSPSDYSI